MSLTLASPTPVPASLEPSNIAPDATQTTSPLVYTLMDAWIVKDVWREYKEGIGGGPAIEQLEMEWQARWRPETK